MKELRLLVSEKMLIIINVGYHLTLLHTKYTGFMPCGFSEEDVYVFPIISLFLFG